MTPDLEAFGTAIKAARLERGWTLEQLAFEVLGNQERKPYCSQIERGKRKLSALTIQKFADKLEIAAALTAPLLGLPLPEADERTETDDTAETLSEDTEALRDKLKLSEALAVALAYKYAEGSPTDIEGALKGLEAAFETAAEQKARDALPSNIDEAVDKVLTEVARLNEEGNPEDADAYLMAEIDKANAEMERQKAQLERFYDRAIPQAVLTRDADAYAERQLQRIQIGTPSAEDQFEALRALQQERYITGFRTGAPFLLSSSIGLAKRCRDIAPREHLRGVAMFDLAIALREHGKRLAGKASIEHLEAAAECEELLLLLWPPDTNPKYWCKVQILKGNTQTELGIRSEREKAALHFAESVAAFDSALSTLDRKANPVDWAMTQNNKGAALQEKGVRTSGAQGAELLAQAVVAYNAALEVRTKKVHSEHWASTQNNKGTALQEQGTRTEGKRSAELLAQAVAAFEAAQEVYTLQDYPIYWAVTQNNKGAALKEQGIRIQGERGAALLLQAVGFYEAALEVRKRETDPVAWAETQVNVAIAKEAWAEHDSAPDPRPLLSEALANVEGALTVFDPQHTSYNHANATSVRDRIRAKLDALP